MTDLTGLGSATPRDPFADPAIEAARRAELAAIEDVERRRKEERQRQERLRVEKLQQDLARARDADVQRAKIEAERLVAIEETAKARVNAKLIKMDQEAAALKAREKRAEAAERQRVRELQAGIDITALENSDDPDLIQAILWTWEHIDVAEVTESPSRGTLSLWDYARKNEQSRKWFFQLMLPKALAAKEREQAKADEARQSDRDMGIDEVTRLLREVDKDDPSLEIKRLKDEVLILKKQLNGPMILVQGERDGERNV